MLLRSLLRGPLTTYRAVAYGFFLAILATVFLIFVTIHDSFLVTVPAAGGTLTEGIIGTPHTINPVLATTDTDKAFTNLIYAGLLKTSTDGTIVPELAKEYSVSPDGRIYTFDLRPTTFHDGKDLTSKDIAFTIAKLQNPALNPTHASYWGDIGVETPDDHTVIIALPNPRADFLLRATIGILPEHVWNEVTDEAFLTHRRNIKPIGAGAFEIRNVNKNDGLVEKITVIRNNNYVLGSPLLKKIHIRMYDNQQELAEAVTDNDITFTSQLLPQTLTNTLLPRKLTVTQIPTDRQVALYHLRGDTGSLAHAGFVTVLSQFIDKEKIIAIVENGYGEALEMNAHPLYVEDTQEKLAALGYRLSNGALTRAGAQVGISIATTNDPDMVLLATTLATQLRSLGITVSIRNFDQGFFQTELDQQTFSAVLLKGTEPPYSYEAVLPLYKTTTPFVVKTTAHGIIPSVHISPVLRYANVNEWYTNTDKLYPFFVKDTPLQTTN